MGSSTIETIKQKIILLGFCEGLSRNFESNLINHCKDIEMACIAVTSLLITPADMDHVICLGKLSKFTQSKTWWCGGGVKIFIVILFFANIKILYRLST